MTAARQYDSVRTTTAAESLFGGRTIPAGMEGVVLEVKSDGTCLVELAFTAQSADRDGDFVQAVLAEGQYKIQPQAGGHGPCRLGDGSFADRRRPPENA